MKSFLIITILLFSGLNNSIAQKPGEDFVKINKAYLEHKDIYIEMVYKVYRNWSDEVPLDIKNAVLKKYGALKYYRLDKLETVLTSNYVITVNHSMKIITLLKSHITPDFDKKADLLQIVDSSIIKTCRKIEFKKEKENLNSYTLTPKHSEYEIIKIVFSSDNYYIRKIIFYYKKEESADGSKKEPKQKPRMEINYVQINPIKEFKSQDFDYSRFLITENGKLVCRKEYRSYQFINQLNN